MINKPLVWLHGEVKTPPLSQDARVEIGMLLRRLQRGELIAMPNSRPMPDIGKHFHELRVHDGETKRIWRLIYRIDSDAIIIAEVFSKTTKKTPQNIIDACKKRFKAYDSI
jgi:phage-related protein